MPHDELLYQLALTFIPLVGDVKAKALVNAFGSAKQVFQAPLRQLEAVENMGTVTAAAIKGFRDFNLVEQELKFIEKHNIQILFFTDDLYPQRLKNCYDGPAVLYYKGTADLNTRKIISIVGTRSNSEYGRQVCEQLIAGLKDQNILIVSGLAFGIDSIAHRAALKNDLQTVGVVAHGHDRIYPPANTHLAKEMLDCGGLLTDFVSGTKPDRQNFPRRNRIVAGMCDALVVVESNEGGGSLITAELANGYNKDIFAFPGRTTDGKSAGCNNLIKNNKANLITGAEDILELMNWKPTEKKQRVQRQLFIDFTPQESEIYQVLNEGAEEGLHIDHISAQSNLTGSEVAQALLMLEMHGIVRSLPGKVYRVI